MKPVLRDAGEAVAVGVVVGLALLMIRLAGCASGAAGGGGQAATPAVNDNADGAGAEPDSGNSNASPHDGASAGLLLPEAYRDELTLVRDCRVSAGHGGATVRVYVNDVGAAYLGGTSFRQLHRAGRVQEQVPGALARADAMFGWDPAPWCPYVF